MSLPKEILQEEVVPLVLETAQEGGDSVDHEPVMTVGQPTNELPPPPPENVVVDLHPRYNLRSRAAGKGRNSESTKVFNTKFT